MKDELPPGSIIGNDYRVIETLGRGGFGITYKCEDIRLRFIIAVKEYFPDGIANRELNSLDVLPKDRMADTFSWGLKKFLLEGTTLAAIQHKYSNEYIVKIIRFIEERKTAYLAMEFIDGMQIDKFASSSKITSAQQVEEIFRSLCIEALKPIHDANFYHRDIKPDNILVRNSNSQPVIIDFGAARQTAGGKSTVAILSPKYSAVEQYASQEDGEDDGDKDLCGSFTDIYSLASTFYFIIKGTPPKDAPSRILDDKTEKLFGDESLSHYSADFRRQIDWGMEPLPKNRPQTINEWLKPTHDFAMSTSDAPTSDTKDTKDTILRFHEWTQDLTFRPALTNLKEYKKFIWTAAGCGFIYVIFSSTLFTGGQDDSLKVVASIPQSSFRSNQPRETRPLPDPIPSEKPTPEPETFNQSWIVGIDSDEWTPIGVLPKLIALKTNTEGSFQLRLNAEEPFRVKTERGLALTKVKAKSFGGINGEVFLKSINGKPQPVEVELMQNN
jgi:serine/threonine protein kinase